MNKTYKRLKGVIKSVDTTNYTVDAVISSSAVDRYNEVIAIDAWKDGLVEYMKHPVLLTSHDYSELTSQIGIALSIGIVGNELIAKFKYFVGEGNPEADWAFNLASKGQAAYSVGFESLASETPSEDINGVDVERIYTKVNLLEVSQVLIPANPEALQKVKQLIADFEDAKDEIVPALKTARQVIEEYADVMGWHHSIRESLFPGGQKEKTADVEKKSRHQLSAGIDIAIDKLIEIQDGINNLEAEAKMEEKKKTDTTLEDRIKELEVCIKDLDKRIMELESQNAKLEKSLSAHFIFTCSHLDSLDSRLKNADHDFDKQFIDDLKTLNLRLKL
jgi:phage head maturation protease/exonuclease VII small subunit